MSARFVRTLAAAGVLLAAGAAWAHKPIVIASPSPSSAENPYAVEDAGLSQVGYHEITPAAPELWYRFAGEAGEAIFLQLGIPKIDRFAGLRPRLALIGPGLPEPEGLPFAVPDGMGALAFDTAGETPEEFNEPFTGTRSWQFAAVEPVLPLSGAYYAVAYLPPGEYGKLWLAIGVAEEWSLADFLTIPAIAVPVRIFHEVFPIGGLLMWVFVLMLLFGAALVLLLLA